MSTRYRVSLDREACDGIFACLVRDDRFEEASDGLATIAGTDTADSNGEMTVSFEDGRIGEARQAAAACPVDAIEITEGRDE